jgi:ferric-dicitrate binding protein FerR (iron transport regulator)
MNNGKDMRPDPLSPEEAREVDKVLRLASDPAIPVGAMERLMARFAAEPQDARVIAMPQRAPVRRSPLRYAAALPLAASLALGVYLGARGTLDFMLPSVITGEIAQYEEEPDELGGVGEADAYAEENLS